eukprot:1159346-Pelagomonas_calceolata.AAC.3
MNAKEACALRNRMEFICGFPVFDCSTIKNCIPPPSLHSYPTNQRLELCLVHLLLEELRASRYPRRLVTWRRANGSSDQHSEMWKEKGTDCR